MSGYYLVALGAVAAAGAATLALTPLARALAAQWGFTVDEGVLLPAAGAYALALVPLFNAQLLFAMNRPRYAVIGAALAAAGNIAWATAGALTHADLAFFAWGLAGAMLVCAVFTTGAMFATARRFSYAYFAAF